MSSYSLSDDGHTRYYDGGGSAPNRQVGVYQHTMDARNRNIYGTDNPYEIKSFIDRDELEHELNEKAKAAAFAKRYADDTRIPTTEEKIMDADSDLWETERLEGPPEQGSITMDGVESTFNKFPTRRILRPSALEGQGIIKDTKHGDQATYRQPTDTPEARNARALESAEYASYNNELDAIMDDPTLIGEARLKALDQWRARKPVGMGGAAQPQSPHSDGRPTNIPAGMKAVKMGGKWHIMTPEQLEEARARKAAAGGR